MDTVATTLGQWWRTHSVSPMKLPSGNHYTIHLWCHPAPQRTWLPFQSQLSLGSVTLLVWSPWECTLFFSLDGETPSLKVCILSGRDAKTVLQTVFLIQFFFKQSCINWVMHPVKKRGREGSGSVGSSKISIATALAMLNREHHL